MNIQLLNEKITKAKEKVEKCKKIVEKHEKQLEKKKEKGDEWDIKWKISDIESAKGNLKDAERILSGWEYKLEEELRKDSFLENNTPQIIKDFLQEWKDKVYKWHIKRYEDYIELKQELAEREYEARLECAKTTPEYAEYLDENGEVKNYWKDLHNLYPTNIMDKYLKDRELDYKNIKSRLFNFAGTTILKMAEFRNENDRLTWLEKTLQEEKRAKMLDLIHRINDVIGAITDASGLSISPKGNLDGIIIGEKGKAKVETIGAGGYNIQCFHYRTLVNKLQ